MTFRDKWVPFTTTYRILRLRIEERHAIWRVPANILNKHSRTADGGSPPAWWLDKVITAPDRKTYLVTERLQEARSSTDTLVRPKKSKRDICGGMNWIELAQDRDRWRTIVNAVMNLRVP
jgi:hypothetical protein